MTNGTYIFMEENKPKSHATNEMKFPIIAS
jgi:hypothetical protein